MTNHGIVEHQIDAKNRIRIPAVYRAELGKEFLFMAGSHGSIFVYPKDVLEAKLAVYSGVTHADPEKLQALRKISSMIFPAYEDSQGRIVLSSFLRIHAKIKQNLVTTCVAGRLELWAKERYEEEVGGMSIDDALKTIGF